MVRIWNSLVEEWNKNWPSLILQLLILVIFGFIITNQLSLKLAPKTDISVECKISKGVNAIIYLNFFFFKTIFV